MYSLGVPVLDDASSITDEGLVLAMALRSGFAISGLLDKEPPGSHGIPAVSPSSKPAGLLPKPAAPCVCFWSFNFSIADYLEDLILSPLD